MKHNEQAVERMARRLAAAEINQNTVTDHYWLYSFSFNGKAVLYRQATAVLDAMVPPGWRGKLLDRHYEDSEMEVLFNWWHDIQIGTADLAQKEGTDA